MGIVPARGRGTGPLQIRDSHPARRVAFEGGSVWILQPARQRDVEFGLRSESLPVERRRLDEGPGRAQSTNSPRQRLRSASRVVAAQTGRAESVTELSR